MGSKSRMRVLTNAGILFLTKVKDKSKIRLDKNVSKLKIYVLIFID